MNYGINATSTLAFRSIMKGISTLPGNCWNINNKLNVTLSNSNLTVTGTSSAGGVTGYTSQSGGKYYMEFAATNLTGSETAVGCCKTGSTLSTLYNGTGGIAVGSSGTIDYNGSSSGDSLGSISNGAIICMAVDLTNQEVWFRVNNGNWNGSGTANPATNTGGISVSGLFSGNSVYPFVAANSASAVVTANFGASSFTYSVPSGFQAGWPGPGNQTITARIEMPDWGSTYTFGGMCFYDGSQYVTFFQWYGGPALLYLQTFYGTAGGTFKSTLWNTSDGVIGSGLEWWQMGIVGGQPQTFSFSTNGQDWIEVYNTPITSINTSFTPTDVGFIMGVQHSTGTPVVSGTNEFYENCLYYSDPDIVAPF
jgi:hypothetical protein